MLYFDCLSQPQKLHFGSLHVPFAHPRKLSWHILGKQQGSSQDTRLFILDSAYLKFPTVREKQLMHPSPWTHVVLEPVSTSNSAE